MSQAVSEKRLVHVTRIPIRWGDMDEMGHVNNAVYFTYMETARIDWLSGIDCAPNPQGEGPVLINAACTFLRQMRYPGEVEVRTLVGEIGRSSIQTWHEMRRVDAPDLLCAEGAAKIVWVNFPQEKSAPLSDDIKAKLLAPTQAALAIAGG